MNEARRTLLPSFRYRLRFLSLIFLFCFSSLCAEEIHYTVQIRGITDGTLKNVIEVNSDLIVLESHPPASLMALKLRIESDINHLLDVMHSYGYYSAKFNYDIITNQAPVLIIINIDQGPLYTFSQFILKAQEGEDPKATEQTQAIIDQLFTGYPLGIQREKPALAGQILETQQKITDVLAANGYAYGKVAQREVVVDQITKTVDVTMTIMPGPLIYFGPVNFLGLCKVDLSWMKRKLKIKPGAVYNPEKINQTRRSLENTGLFSTIEIVSSEDLGPDNSLPITIVVVENKRRSIAFGVSYTTDQSFGVLASWENRNLLGRGEDLAFKISANAVIQEANLQFRKPDFRRLDEDLLWQLQHRIEHLKSYDDRSTSLLGAIERTINPYLFFSYGAKLEALHTFQDGAQADYLLLSLPTKTKYTKVNNQTLPTLGYTLDFRFSPYTDLTGFNHSFSVQRLTATFFSPLIDDAVVIMARTSCGIIAAKKTTSVPASIRFYEGSYGGLRGYTYQTVSPLDSDNDPIGGRSLILYSLETRIRVTQKFYFIPFYDVGDVFSDSFPKLIGKFRRSWGTGFSYVTAIGPIRFDIAFPLDRRPGLDKSFQIYFSMGATF